MGEQIFAGVKVADFSWVAAGPLTTKALADHGATVVRVESSLRPCPARTSAPYKDGVPGLDRSGWYAFVNSDKYSMALDLRHLRAAEVTRRLVAWADVVADSFTPGTMEKLGLGYEDLKKIKPDIIMLRTCQQGQTGPHAKAPGYGVQLSGLTGFTQLTGWPDREPAQPFGAYNDFITPYFSTSALVAALDYRRRSGKGMLLDISQYEAGLQFLAVPLLNYTANDRINNRMGNRDTVAAPCNSFHCQGDDRWCVITVSSDAEWRAFCEAIGSPAWAKDQRFSTVLGRKQHEAELDSLVEEWTGRHTAEEVMAVLQAKGVATGIVQKPGDVYQDTQLRHRNFFWEMEHGELGKFGHLGQPFQLSRTPAQPRMPAPCLGEHTYHVCTTMLGLSDSEFADLAEASVFR